MPAWLLAVNLLVLLALLAFELRSRFAKKGTSSEEPTKPGSDEKKTPP